MNQSKKATFATVMNTAAVFSGIIFALLAASQWYFHAGWLSALTITAGTTCYHFFMRLAIGAVVPMFKSRIDPQNRWFQPKFWEAPLYKMLGVKRWKGSMPTYDPKDFSPEANTMEQIVRNMCNAELVHEVIVVFSFLPLVFSKPLDAFWPFLITSVAAAAVDCLFVIMQRYNRPRLMRVLAKQNSKCPNAI